MNLSERYYLARPFPARGAERKDLMAWFIIVTLFLLYSAGLFRVAVKWTDHRWQESIRDGARETLLDLPLPIVDLKATPPAGYRRRGAHWRDAHQPLCVSGLSAAQITAGLWSNAEKRLRSGRPAETQGTIDYQLSHGEVMEYATRRAIAGDRRA